MARGWAVAFLKVEAGASLGLAGRKIIGPRRPFLWVLQSFQVTSSTVHSTTDAVSSRGPSKTRSVGGWAAEWPKAASRPSGTGGAPGDTTFGNTRRQVLHSAALQRSRRGVGMDELGEWRPSGEGHRGAVAHPGILPFLRFTGLVQGMLAPTFPGPPSHAPMVEVLPRVVCSKARHAPNGCARTMVLGPFPSPFSPCCSAESESIFV